MHQLLRKRTTQKIDAKALYPSTLKECFDIELQEDKNMTNHSQEIDSLK